GSVSNRMAYEAYVLVFVAGLIAAFGTSLGAVPLFWLDDISDALDVGLWGFAGGLMASASVFGLLYEAYLHDSPIWMVGIGFVVGILLVIGAHSLVERFEDYEPEDMATADFQTMLNILIVLFVHSFPEGIAIGISFGELNAIQQGHGFHVLGFAVPFVAVVLTLSLAIHNIPEGVATAIPMRDTVSNARMWGAAFFTSIPQPVGAVIAFYFIRIFEQLLGFGYGLSAGAMLYLVVADVIPDGLESGEDLPNNGRTYLTAGAFVGFISMVPLLFML
ncbi:MAG: ZIP family metal transporter, partial [Haloarculaceae archaeon]